MTKTKYIYEVRKNRKCIAAFCMECDAKWFITLQGGNIRKLIGIKGDTK